MNRILGAPTRCAIILAAGEGKRLQPFIYRLRGDVLPKQYVRFIGTRSLLENTFCRAESLIPPHRIFTVISRNHLNYPEVRQQLSGRPCQTVVVQPENKETGPGILLPLVHVFKRFPDSAVAVFPSDHFVLEENLFRNHVAAAFNAVERNPLHLVLLGVEPSRPEPEYGYIVPGKEVYPMLLEVLRFVEKPDADAALRLIQSDGLWNTMVMIFKARTMMELICRAAPDMYCVFEGILNAIATTTELEAVDCAYRRLQSINFSKGLLEKFSVRYGGRLMVVPVKGVHWSDWGSERRIMSTLQEIGHLTEDSLAMPF